MGADHSKHPHAVGEEVMRPRAHGTCDRPVQEELRWGVDRSTADRICCFNRRFAERSGYFRSTALLSEGAGGGGAEIQFRDSVTGKVLFVAPRGRTWEQFVAESEAHGWPSFRDQEVEWSAVGVLGDGEVVSLDGTHLGHNLPDAKGNRYCINLVSVAGTAPPDDE
eukprot:TRINITY_DN1111_c0_g1_i1.p1 TRINITY_DN1111_c0_g1~~TRINITY_DN1111_c0_g1_i1.p1  ORF type:complete len:166 (-),score=53.05 TRINITY_DN1111_c0_g1_i1:218-715(-)